MDITAIMLAELRSIARHPLSLNRLGECDQTTLKGLRRRGLIKREGAFILVTDAGSELLSHSQMNFRKRPSRFLSEEVAALLHVSKIIELDNRTRTRSKLKERSG